MGIKQQKAKEVAEGNIRLQSNDIEKVCKESTTKKEKYPNGKPGRKPAEKAISINDADMIKITSDHFFNGKVAINELIEKINDPRNIDMSTYSQQHLIWEGLLMFIFRLQSRVQLGIEKDNNFFKNNLLELSNSDEEHVASPDTMNYYLENLPPNELENLKVKLVKALMSNRVLDNHRLNYSYRIAIDATGLFSSQERHCERCLVQKHNEETTTYSHKILEAKLVSEIGFAFSVLSEPIENVEGKYIKQDCELKAFYRMEKKLKDLFPRTNICLLLDGLYACEEVFKICKEQSWEYMVVFQTGSIPTLYKKAQIDANKSKHNSIIVENEDEKNEISWTNSLDYKGQRVYVIFNKRTVYDKGIEKTSEECWITNIPPSKKNAEDLIKKGGRQRWKIENQGFKEQKCDGFELEHLYGEAEYAWKNYYQLLQIAHFITQLMRYGDLFVKLQKEILNRYGGRLVDSFMKYFTSVKNFVKKLLFSFKTNTFSGLTQAMKGKIQIRFPIN